MIAMLLAEVLEDMGNWVSAIAATEEDAVTAAISCKPGLMIVDEHLREGTGLAVERIRSPCQFRVCLSAARPWIGTDTERQYCESPSWQ